MVTQEFTASVGAIKQDVIASLNWQFNQLKFRYNAQPPAVQRSLETQARLIAKGIEERRSPIYFILPDQIACEGNDSAQPQIFPVPAELREQKIGDLLGQLSISDLDRRLRTLEVDQNPAVSTVAALMRFSIVQNLAQSVLPADRSEWVVFDENSNLLVNSIDEAREIISSMSHALDVLENLIKLAPYIIADKDFQWKRYGVQAQLVNQGRALAQYEIGEIIRTIRRRAEAHTLDRGLNLSLPYFDDQALQIKIYSFEIIPPGRVGFDPLFIVWAARYQQSEVTKQKKISPTTCKHLLDLLKFLECAFDKPARNPRSH